MTMPSTRWSQQPAHRAWLGDQFARLVAFTLPSIRPEGGFHWLDAAGTPMRDRRPELYLAARACAVGAQGLSRGVPGAGAIMRHGVLSLHGVFHDEQNDGWASASGDRKEAYAHVHVAYAAAQAVGGSVDDQDRTSAQRLLTASTAVIERHFWDEQAGALRESFSWDWGEQESYRGANSNMHGVEAFLAVAAVTQEEVWLHRSLRMAERLIDTAARRNDWLLPEHYTADWEPDLQHNEDDPRHQFRPYGWTPGHALEWARLLALLDVSLRARGLDAPAWVMEAAAAQARVGIERGWGPDGGDGLVYTTDWAGTPIEPKRLHWPVCEGIQACAVLGALTGDPWYEQWYRRLWDHAARFFVDAGRGTWRNELDPDLTPAEDIWPGRPDVYHIAGALLTPLYPPTGCLAAASADSSRTDSLRHG